jgi:ADP-ribosylation factor-like protein 6
MAVAKDELEMLLKHANIKSRPIPILVLANKMDLKDALSSVRVAQCLGLDQGLVEGKPWQIQSTNALTGEGLVEGVDWLSDQIKVMVSRKK